MQSLAVTLCLDEYDVTSAGNVAAIAVATVPSEFVEPRHAARRPVAEILPQYEAAAQRKDPERYVCVICKLVCDRRRAIDRMERIRIVRDRSAGQARIDERRLDVELGRQKACLCAYPGDPRSA